MPTVFISSIKSRFDDRIAHRNSSLGLISCELPAYTKTMPKDDVLQQLNYSSYWLVVDWKSHRLPGAKVQRNPPVRALPLFDGAGLLCLGLPSLPAHTSASTPRYAIADPAPAVHIGNFFPDSDRAAFVVRLLSRASLQPDSQNALSTRNDPYMFWPPPPFSGERDC